MTKEIYLPTEQTERAKVLDDLMKQHTNVVIHRDEQGRTIAEVSEEPKLEKHPTTGLPILLD